MNECKHADVSETCNKKLSSINRVSATTSGFDVFTFCLFNPAAQNEIFFKRLSAFSQNLLQSINSSNRHREFTSLPFTEEGLGRLYGWHCVCGS
jgi:hypothetical protein